MLDRPPDTGRLKAIRDLREVARRNHLFRGRFACFCAVSFQDSPMLTDAPSGANGPRPSSSALRTKPLNSLRDGGLRGQFEQLEPRQMLAQMVADFGLVDVNSTSSTYNQPVSPRDFVGVVSGWYFGQAT